MHLGIIGFGSIGQELAALLATDPPKSLTVLVRPHALEAARTGLERSALHAYSVVPDIGELIAASPDLIVECAGQIAAVELVPQVLCAGIPVILASIGALADDDAARSLNDAARVGGAKLILPAGAIGGIDFLGAIALAGGLTVCYRGTKPPAAWKGTPAEAALDLDTLTGPTTLFTGTAREAARTYPKNANVAATLALAGAGFEATRVELVADPDARGNRHAYSAESQLGRFSVEIENAASSGNAKTSLTTVYSILREVRRWSDPVVL